MTDAAYTALARSVTIQRQIAEHKRSAALASYKERVTRLAQECASILQQIENSRIYDNGETLVSIAQSASNCLGEYRAAEEQRLLMERFEEEARNTAEPQDE